MNDVWIRSEYLKINYIKISIKQLRIVRKNRMDCPGGISEAFVVKWYAIILIFI